MDFYMKRSLNNLSLLSLGLKSTSCYRSDQAFAYVDIAIGQL